MSTAAASYIEATRVGTTDMINVVANDNIQLSTGSNTPRLRINSNGNVGIGTVAPSQKLHVAGNVLATAFLYSSDANLKENVKTVSGLDGITKLRGVTFDWKANKKADVGLIAQEVETVYPELVTTDKEGLKSVQYGNLVAPLIEAIKEQQIQIEALQAEVNELKK
jgi:glycerophosphoryl diester phosphodiesterase